MSTPHSSSVSPARTPWRQRLTGQLLVGVLVGFVAPLLSFVPVALGSGEGRAVYAAGNMVWAATALAGALLLMPERTRRFGTGVLLGFMTLVIVGAGACTVAVMGFGLLA